MVMIKVIGRHQKNFDINGNSLVQHDTTKYINKAFLLQQFFFITENDYVSVMDFWSKKKINFVKENPMIIPTKFSSKWFSVSED